MGEEQKEDEREEDDGEFPGKRDGNLAAKCVMALVPSRLVSSRFARRDGKRKRATRAVATRVAVKLYG